MSTLALHYTVSGDDFSHAGEASAKVKKQLKALGFPANVIRNVVVALYEGEINMVIHANGGTIDVEVTPEKIQMVLKDSGPGIADIEKAMQKGFSTAPAEIRDLGFGAGMGLPNIQKFTDDMHLESVVGQGTTLTLSVLVKN